MSEKITVIDIGSGSLKASVFFNKNGKVRVLSGISQEIRICSQIGTAIQADSVEQIIAFLQKVLKLAETNDSKKIIAVATQAARTSTNFSNITTKILARTGINVRLISGIQEAEFLAKNIQKNTGLEKFVSLDLGCGSLELAEFNGKILNSWSLPLSAINLSQMNDFKKAETAVEKAVSSVKFSSDDISDFPLIGSGGSLRLIRALITKNKRNIITTNELQDLWNDMQNKEDLELIAMGIPQKRIKILPISIIIIRNIMKHMGVQEIFIEQDNLRSSIASDYFNNFSQQNAE